MYDEDEIRENIQPYHDEGGGEEDNVRNWLVCQIIYLYFKLKDLYELRLLQPLEAGMLTRIDEKPLLEESQARIPLASNVKDYINNVIFTENLF